MVWLSNTTTNLVHVRRTERDTKLDFAVTFRRRESSFTYRPMVTKSQGTGPQLQNLQASARDSRTGRRRQAKEAGAGAHYQVAISRDWLHLVPLAGDCLPC